MDRAQGDARLGVAPINAHKLDLGQRLVLEEMAEGRQLVGGARRRRYARSGGAAVVTPVVPPVVPPGVTPGVTPGGRGGRQVEALWQGGRVA